MLARTKEKQRPIQDSTGDAQGEDADLLSEN